MHHMQISEHIPLRHQLKTHDSSSILQQSKASTWATNSPHAWPSSTLNQTNPPRQRPEKEEKEKKNLRLVGQDTRMKKVGLLFFRSISIHFLEEKVSWEADETSSSIPHAQITYNPCKENALKDF
ncbi:hypothetical protein CEXT_240101 [Caerostris extrusa]|uniref:Uncharacterized protein n=1 Tax=Caerostris extrusa TaxID=172846 RepID=A0AAV4PWX4_CAEEX|nr:hypothetical protein CEXT_240101 [Caerostris extrusa]